jgi:hypothetical protein
MCLFSIECVLYSVNIALLTSLLSPLTDWLVTGANVFSIECVFYKMCSSFTSDRLVGHSSLWGTWQLFRECKTSSTSMAQKSSFSGAVHAVCVSHP